MIECAWLSASDGASLRPTSAHRGYAAARCRSAQYRIGSARPPWRSRRPDLLRLSPLRPARLSHHAGDLEGHPESSACALRAGPIRAGCLRRAAPDAARRTHAIAPGRRDAAALTQTLSSAPPPLSSSTACSASHRVTSSLVSLRPALALTSRHDAADGTCARCRPQVRLQTVPRSVPGVARSAGSESPTNPA